MPDDLTRTMAELDAALKANRAGVAALDESIARGNVILRRKTVWIAATCASVALDVVLTVTLAVLGLQLQRTQDDTTASQVAVRANTCNLNTLFAQSIANSGNTVDLYRGLRPLLEASGDPTSRAAVAFIDRSIANLERNEEIRAGFLALTEQTARRLRCPAGFVTE